MPHRASLCLLASALLAGCFSAGVPIDPGGMPGGMDPEINWGIWVRPAPDVPRFRVGVPLPEWDGTGNATPRWPQELLQVLRLKEGNATFRVEESEWGRLLVVEGIGPTSLQAVLRSPPDADGATYLRSRLSTANVSGPFTGPHQAAVRVEGDIDEAGVSLHAWDGACRRDVDARATAPVPGWSFLHVQDSEPSCPRAIA